MIKLLFIVPYPELRDCVEYVLANHQERDSIDAEIRTMTVEQTPDVPADEYDAIIARGYTAQKTSHMYSGIPTIDLNISGYDILRAIHECKEMYHPKKIAICGFGASLYEAGDVCRMLGLEAEIYAPVLNKDLPMAIEKAIDAGCDAVIGGYSANILAGERGLHSVIIRTGADAVSQAMDEAIRTVTSIRQERIVAQMYKTIIYSSDSGLLYVDKEGVIRVRNRVARKMNGNVSLMNRFLKEAIPWLDSLFVSVIKSEQEESRFITVPGTKVVLSVKCTPVVANKEMSGTIFSLSDVTQIQELEAQIRRKLSERGLKARYTFDDIIHSSSTIDHTIELARQYAKSDSNVIIVGETGTGKELFAQSIHNASARKGGPFVAINCAALPENLLESELFGYVEGAFTGTSKGGKKGLFEQAHGGTLFLDEIGEISMATQTKLLRVLQEHQVRRIGDNKVIDLNVRIISATNKSISRMARAGRFRQDLVYRLDVLRLYLPPLRDRENDAELLFKYLLNKIGTERQNRDLHIEAGALSILGQYPFRGNIRELHNIVERVYVMSENNTITQERIREALYPQDLEDDYVEASEYVQEEPDRRLLDVELGEPVRIRRALEMSRGNKGQAAELLGIDRSTLWRKMKKYDIRE